MKWKIEFEATEGEGCAARYNPVYAEWCNILNSRCPGLGDPGCPAKPVEEGK